jgi:hypothetical protein
MVPNSVKDSVRDAAAKTVRVLSSTAPCMGAMLVGPISAAGSGTGAKGVACDAQPAPTSMTINSKNDSNSERNMVFSLKMIELDAI